MRINKVVASNCAALWNRLTQPSRINGFNENMRLISCVAFQVILTIITSSCTFQHITLLVSQESDLVPSIFRRNGALPFKLHVNVSSKKKGENRDAYKISGIHSGK